MERRVRVKFGRTKYSQAVDDIRRYTELITSYIGIANQAIGAALEICDKRKNAPFVGPFITNLANISMKLTSIQEAASNIRSAVEEIDRISTAHLSDLEKSGQLEITDNGD